MNQLRGFILLVGLLAIWQLLVFITGVPPYILPGPLPVLQALVTHFPLLLGHLGTTFTEILLGLILGTLLGTTTALSMIISPLLKRWMLPILVISQAIPVFALAPVLVLWFGYGMTSKVAMAVLIIYFPVTASFYGECNAQNPTCLIWQRSWVLANLPFYALLLFPLRSRDSPPACGWRQQSPPSAPWLGNGSDQALALAITCCMPMLVCRLTVCLLPSLC